MTAVVTLAHCLLPPNMPPAAATSQSFSIDLSTDGWSQYNINHTARGLGLLGPQGFYVTAPISMHIPASRIRPNLSVQAPPGATVMLELRGQTPAARWTEWREANPDANEVVLPADSTQVQARITLTRHEAGPGPEVLGLQLLVLDPPPDRPRTARSTPPLTSRVYATRIGLIGSRTANGHAIGTADRFVALPSRRALNANIREKAYEVRICYAHTKRCAVAPIWDVGPWNVRDDYWNAARDRQMWTDLPRGRPQAQAAYARGYNEGLDDRSRKVRNPAGIDLADSLFWKDLGMATNDWVTVTYLWTGEETLT